MVGDNLGSYKILGKIGEGGMGTVYRAEHALIGRKAAIKVLLPELSSRADVVRRFFNEARAIADLNHPAVVGIFDFGFHTDGSGYIVMELLEGESLAARLERVGRLDSANAIRVTRQIAGAMAVAHSHGIIHRDLKPDNLFLVPDRTGAPGDMVKILDFGVAKLAGDGAQEGPGLTQTGMMLGTPLFMAPEQCRGAGLVDARADIYALGCVLYIMLCGRPPFAYDFPGELIAAHLHETPEGPRVHEASIAPALDEVVLRMLAKRPEDRQPSMQALLDDLERAAKASPPGTNAEPAPGASASIREAANVRHTRVLPKLRDDGRSDSDNRDDESPVTAAAPSLRRLSVTTLGRGAGEISGGPSRGAWRYWVGGAAVLVTAVGLAAVLLSPPSAKRPVAATGAPAPTAPTPAPPATEPKAAPAPPVVTAPTAEKDETVPVAPAIPPPTKSAAPEYVTFKIEGAEEAIAVKLDGKSVSASGPLRLPRDRAVHSIRVSSAHFLPESFSKRADADRTLRLKNELRPLTAPGGR
ncbi:MAG TPA: serine/threonine-protein kinase [Polyangia bacterium]|nr:serine/threonine-protein kinase [Polyangia bacterium]